MKALDVEQIARRGDIESVLFYMDKLTTAELGEDDDQQFGSAGARNAIFVLQLAAEYLHDKRENLKTAAAAPRESLAAQFTKARAQYEHTIAAATKEIAGRDKRIGELQKRVAIEEERARRMKAALGKCRRKESEVRRKRPARKEDSESEPGVIHDGLGSFRKSRRPQMIEVERPAKAPKFEAQVEPIPSRPAKPPKIERKPVPIRPQPAKPPPPRRKAALDLSEGEVRIGDDDSAGTLSGDLSFSLDAPISIEEEEEEEEPS
jgi:hypothetical protein